MIQYLRCTWRTTPASRRPWGRDRGTSRARVRRACPNARLFPCSPHRGAQAGRLTRVAVFAGVCTAALAGPRRRSAHRCQYGAHLLWCARAPAPSTLSLCVGAGPGPLPSPARRSGLRRAIDRAAAAPPPARRVRMRLRPVSCRWQWWGCWMVRCAHTTSCRPFSARA